MLCCYSLGHQSLKGEAKKVRNIDIKIIIETFEDKYEKSNNGTHVNRKNE